MEPLNNLLRMLDALRASGAEKVNFAGGEPFLYPELLGALVRHAKRESGFASVSVISNAARITRAWFEQHGANLDFLGVSCDSVDAQTNHKHGRGPAGAVRAVDRTRDVRAAAALAREFGSRFKVNTVVTDSKFFCTRRCNSTARCCGRLKARARFACICTCRACPPLPSSWEARSYRARRPPLSLLRAVNKDETSLAALVNELKPDRWKIFQVLPIEGENTGMLVGGGSEGGSGSSESSSGGGGGGGTIAAAVAALPARRARARRTPFAALPISDAHFHAFVERNRAELLPALRAAGIIKAEDNSVMRSSYVIIDEFGRFLDTSRGGKAPSRPILNAATGALDIDAAAEDLLGADGHGFDRSAFHLRDGYYPSEWSRLM